MKQILKGIQFGRSIKQINVKNAYVEKIYLNYLKIHFDFSNKRKSKETAVPSYIPIPKNFQILLLYVTLSN